jgi:CRP/FNR family transcriptional regulator
MVCISYDRIQEGLNKYRNIATFGRLIAEEALVIQTNRVESFLFETPDERYVNFIEENKEISNRISLSHLSSLLGIERQSLIRIRNRIAKK